MSRNIMLTIAFEGTRYCGWQLQPDAPTVQEFIERATEKLTGVHHRVLCASRTDSGVHALGQVASFQTECSIPAERFRRGLQRFLPPDISIVQSQEVSADFHATYSAIRKRYRYLLFDGEVMPPFLRNLAYHHRSELNVSAMQRALPFLLGTHDFRCFETQYPNKATSVRTIKEATLQRVPVWSMWESAHEWIAVDARARQEPKLPLICFEIMADGFLYNMVRAIVGTLIQVGRSQKPPEHLADVIASQDRSRAGTTVPAAGLYLVQVDYPPEQLQAPQ
ncbi:MAG: tRNA pseudouridine(38-40) synthase TruA [Planctomycetaceae bacterium]